MLAIIQFLGYNPLRTADGWGGRLVRQRSTLGPSQKQSAKRIGPRKGLRVLALEDDYGYDMIESLDKTQQDMAVV